MHEKLMSVKRDCFKLAPNPSPNPAPQNSAYKKYQSILQHTFFFCIDQMIVLYFNSSVINEYNTGKIDTS